jgi:1-phosphofructokinase
VSVLVVSTHPAIDAEWRVARVVPGEKNEVLEERRWPGGKGVNVCRWLHWLGTRHTLLLPLGGSTGRELATGLRGEGIRFKAVPFEGPTRVNVVVSPDQGSQLRFNPTWPRFDGDTITRFREAFVRELRHARLVVLSGALVPGAPVGFYRELSALAVEAGCRIVLDCDGRAFEQGIRAKPALVKPNEHELAAWAGEPVKRPADAERAARTLSRRTGGWVLASLGARGALLVHDGHGVVLSQPAARVKVRNTVGAGDAMLAAAVSAMARRADVGDWLDEALRVASLAVQLPPGEVPARPPRPKPRMSSPRP